MPEFSHKKLNLLEGILQLSERVFFVSFDQGGIIRECSSSLCRITGDICGLQGRKIEEIFLPSSGAGLIFKAIDLLPAEPLSPVLARLALSGRPCRLIAAATESGIECWGEVIGDRTTTGLNELSGLTGQIQGLLSEVRRQKELLEKDLLAAAWLQHRFLPKNVDFKGLKVAWKFRPCDSIGGDFCSVFPLPDESIGAYLLDVAGHGVPSAMMGVAVAQTLQQFVSHFDGRRAGRKTMAELLARLENEFPLERFNLYFTMIYLEYNQFSRTLHLVNAGHPSPILQRVGETAIEITDAGPFIGMDCCKLVPQVQIELNPGDRLYIYSDGITERRSGAGEFFEKSRLLQLLTSDREKSLQESLDELEAENDAFAGGQSAEDDFTILGLEALP